MIMYVLCHCVDSRFSWNNLLVCRMTSLFIVAASLKSSWLLWWPPAESHYNIYDHSAVVYVSHAHCIGLLCSVGNKVTTTTISTFKFMYVIFRRVHKLCICIAFYKCFRILLGGYWESGTHRVARHAHYFMTFTTIGYNNRTYHDCIYSLLLTCMWRLKWSQVEQVDTTKTK